MGTDIRTTDARVDERRVPVHELLDMIFQAVQAQALAVAAELGIPDLLKGGPRRSDELAAATGSCASTLERLLRLLAHMGVVAESGGGQFTCTTLGRLLQAGGEHSLRDYARLTNRGMVLQIVAQLRQSIQSGKSQYEVLHGSSFYAALQDMPGESAIFNGAMREISQQDTLVMLDSYDFSNCKTLVDVGGGQGFLLGSLLDRYPDLRAVLFDLPDVVGGIDKGLAPHISSERCRVVAGNFLQGVPPGADVYLLKRVLSHCSDDEARALLSNIRAVIAPAGRLLVADPGPGTLYGASYDLLMLVLLGGGLRSDEELRALFGAARFNHVRAIETPGELRLVEAAVA